MSEHLESDLRRLLAARSAVQPEELDRLRAAVSELPARTHRTSWAAPVAAGLATVLLVAGVIALSQLVPLGVTGGAPGPPDPDAFAGDPRLAVCGATPDDAVAIFEMAHVRDYPRHLPAAYPLRGLDADPEAPALVIVLASREPGGRLPAASGPEPTLAPGRHHLCLVVGTDASDWRAVSVVDVDTGGMAAFLPEPAGTPLAPDLAPWAERCGGEDAGILTVVLLARGRDVAARLVLLPEPTELATDLPAAVVVYDAGHPFEPLGTPPAAGATVAPRDPLADGHHDLCVVVGDDPATAQRHLHEDVLVRFQAVVGPPASSPPGPTPDVAPGPLLPRQLRSSECDSLSFAPDRCLAVVEEAREQASLDWSQIVAVELEPLLLEVIGPHPVATVLFTLGDGTRHRQDVVCGGIFVFSLVCTDRPQVMLIAPYGPSGGYRDIPCAGEGPAGCATPLPTIDPGAAEAAVPLEVPALDVPLTRTGRLEIPVGWATLPNGILSDARFSLADPAPQSFRVKDGITMVVRRVDSPGEPLSNLYDHGWREGGEQVEVVLALEVTWIVPGAVLEIRDLVVR